MSVVEFVDSLPAGADHVGKWEGVRAELAARPGIWARIGASGGYPRQRLTEFGCEVRVVGGVTFARWPSPMSEGPS